MDMPFTVPRALRPTGRAGLRACVVALAVTIAGEGADAQDDVSANACADQIAQVLVERFAQTVRSIEFRWQQPKSLGSIWNLSEAIATVDECPGYHYFVINGDEYLCERQRHVGAVPGYVMYRSANDGC